MPLVDPSQMIYDIGGTVVDLSLTFALWAFLFLFVWERGPFARSLGFDRTAFWLLAFAGVLSILADVPFAAIQGNGLAVNLGGAIFPLALSAVLFRRFAPPAARSFGLFVAVFGVESLAALAAVLYVADPARQDLAVALVAIVGPAIVLMFARSSFAALRRLGVAFGRVGAVLALSSAVLLFTFLASSAVPGYGIVIAFPTYLLPPIAAGFAAVLAAPAIFGTERARALPLAYAATTFGVLIGADLLRQPPLYGAGSPHGLYVIGGANVLDLVYLSGLLALFAAYAAYRWTEGKLAPLPMDAPPSPAIPTHELSEALRMGLGGDSSGSIRLSAQAARDAAEQARRLRAVPPAPRERPWSGLPVPGWAVADQANLDSIALAAPDDGSEALRAWKTSRHLVGLGRQLGWPRFASARRRWIAFAIDLAILIGPAAGVWWAITLEVGTTSSSVLASLPEVAASYGFVGYSFLYFALGAAAFGSTLGKRLLGLEVCSRDGQRPGLVASFVRESTKLPLLSAVGILGPAIVALLAGWTGAPFGLSGISPLQIVTVLVVAIGLTAGIAGLTGLFGIRHSSERQRLGDRLAHTWVLGAPPSRPIASPGEAAPASA